MEIYDFAKLGNIKIVVALRENILAKVEATPRRGYQIEKLASQRIRLTWTEDELRDLLTARFDALRLDDEKIPDPRTIFPKGGPNRQNGIDYILSRCQGRPRDVINFVNLAIQGSSGKSSITLKAIKGAEVRFSADRRDAILEEWHENYAGLDALFRLVQGRAVIAPSSWTEDDILEVLMDSTDGRAEEWRDWIGQPLSQANTTELQVREAAYRAARILYEVGVVGFRVGDGGQLHFAYTPTAEIPKSLTEQSNLRLVVPRTLYSAFEITRTA